MLGAPCRSVRTRLHAPSQKGPRRSPFSPGMPKQPSDYISRGFETSFYAHETASILKMLNITTLSKGFSFLPRGSSSLSRVAMLTGVQWENLFYAKSRTTAAAASHGLICCLYTYFDDKSFKASAYF